MPGPNPVNDAAAAADASDDDATHERVPGAVDLATADELVDEMSKESFPTSDPPSTWAGADGS